MGDGLVCSRLSLRGVNVGDIVDVVGTVVLHESEVCLSDANSTVIGHAAVKPLGLSNLALGGGSHGRQGAVWSRDARQVWRPADGASNIGLLVTVWVWSPSRIRPTCTFA